MTEHNLAKDTMRTVRFHRYGEPADVLQMDETVLPDPGQNRIRVRVIACGLNPADWALCRGSFPGNLPRGIGLDVSGVIDAVGAGCRCEGREYRVLRAVYKWLARARGR